MISLCDPSRRVLSELMMVARLKQRTLLEQMAEDHVFSPEGKVNASSIRVVQSIITTNIFCFWTDTFKKANLLRSLFRANGNVA